MSVPIRCNRRLSSHACSGTNCVAVLVRFHVRMTDGIKGEIAAYGTNLPASLVARESVVIDDVRKSYLRPNLLHTRSWVGMFTSSCISLEE